MCISFVLEYQISLGESSYYRSTYKALIKPTPNLNVQKYSQVNKVLDLLVNGLYLLFRSAIFDKTTFLVTDFKIGNLS